MNWILLKDAELGKRVHEFAKSSVLRHIASVISLSVDEAVWFVGPLLIASALAYLKFLEPTYYAKLNDFTPDATTPVSFCLDVFVEAMAITTGSSLLKLFTLRSRPSYVVQEKYHIVNGDRYSFPSGHTMFAAIVSRRGFGHGGTLQFVICLICVASVGWSRVAKGRHYPADVLAGAACGLAVAEIPLRGFTVEWMWIKFGMLVVCFCEVALAVVKPRFRTPGFRTGILKATSTQLLLIS